MRIVGKLVLSPKKKDNLDRDSEYYTMVVKTPNNSITLIRCIVKQIENIEKWNRELDDGCTVEIRGYLRNEVKGKQILVRVISWEKIDTNFEELDETKCNQVRLLGKVVNDIDTKDLEEKTNFPSTTTGVVSFKIYSQQTISNGNNIYFCRVNSKKKIPELNQIKKGFIVAVDGFLQTKKVVNENTQTVEERISSIICQSIKIIDNADPSENFFSFNVPIITIPIEKIDFAKPKSNNKDSFIV